MAAQLTAGLPWLARLQAAAVVAPARPRLPLWAGSAEIGSVEAGFLDELASQPNGRIDLVLSKEEHLNGRQGWHVLGDDLTASLNALAGLMRDAGLAGAWRNEQLAVHDPQGQRLGTIERAAVRPLGIPTRAVHLVGQSADGGMWVQQRAFDKPNDPGLWDTLMGGMVSSEDTLETALARETWEEAGLNLADLQGMHYGGRLSTARPSTDGDGRGYVREEIDWFRCSVPDALKPNNQDGEVEQFRLMSTADVIERMARGEFTLEAALILASAMGIDPG